MVDVILNTHSPCAPKSSLARPSVCTELQARTPWSRAYVFGVLGLEEERCVHWRQEML